ncbi:ABC transporter ATP-binding protein [Streptomyces sp. NPDC056909]|uniref:ABC transporter ATP-binding protein n=1 Tax=Streptomyces sp. NPDC056909 TaxID=3345963 RepID=UPI0036B56086
MTAGEESRAPAADSAHLPVAGAPQVRRAAVRLIRQDGRAFAGALALNVLAAAAGLIGPWLVGRIVNTVRAGGGVDAVDRYALVILVCALAQVLLGRYARLIGHRFGERTSARIREQLVDRALALPASAVERAGTGDLTARGTSDVTAVSRRTRLRTLSLRTVLFPAVEVSYVVPVVAVLLVGGLLSADAGGGAAGPGAVSLGTVISCALYLTQLSHPLDAVLLWVEQLQSSEASFARVEGLGLAPRLPRYEGPTPSDDRIEVARVSYAYDSGRAAPRDVLRGVDLTVRPGERLAVVGPSGAGKSTLGRLLAGVDRPRAGSVTVGTVPVADLGPDELRRQVVLVTQEHHVFIDTVRDNLLIAAPAATDEEIRAALDAVGADWIDELPEGLDTELGAGEVRVDGARAQQLALARVVLADPHILILDEATALLDPATARHAERALAAVLEGRTVIAIAHRLDTARDADRVAVMDDGRLTELGTHDALVAAGGPYAELWRSWHGEPSRPPEPPESSEPSRPAAG